MEKKRTQRIKRSVALVLSVLLAVVLGGCFASYGVVRPSAEVDKLFETHQVLADHRYYMDGSDLRPSAIIAIHKEYNLQSSLWRPVALTKTQLSGWVDEMTRYRGYSLYTYGAKIIGPDSRQIGVWYSPHQITKVQQLEGNNVMVLTPAPPSGPDANFGFFAPAS
jgi:hypothetical protein